jgi:hypothetical protein
MFNNSTAGDSSTKHTNFCGQHVGYCFAEDGSADSPSRGGIGRQPPRVDEGSERPLSRKIAPAAPAMPSTISTRRMKFIGNPSVWGVLWG